MVLMAIQGWVGWCDTVLEWVGSMFLLRQGLLALLCSKNQKIFSVNDVMHAEYDKA